MREGKTSATVTKNVVVVDAKTLDKSKKYACSNNDEGKNPMTRTQWRRYQRSKKGVATYSDDNAVDPKGKQKVVKIVKIPMKERLSLPPVEESYVGDDEMDSNFMDSDFLRKQRKPLVLCVRTKNKTCIPALFQNLQKLWF